LTPFRGKRYNARNHGLQNAKNEVLSVLLGRTSIKRLWWFVLIIRGVLPAVFAIGMGILVGAIQRGESLGFALRLSVVFCVAADSGADPSGG
jgi:hypothetical protein